MRCVYLDLDGTLLGPGASLLRGADGRFALEGVRALQACARAGAEGDALLGRRQSSVFEWRALIGCSAYCFDVGCGLVIDGDLEWLTGGVVPSEQEGTIHDQIERSGAPALLLSGTPAGSSTTRRGTPDARCRTCSGGFGFGGGAGAAGCVWF